MIYEGTSGSISDDMTDRIAVFDDIFAFGEAPESEFMTSRYILEKSHGSGIGEGRHRSFLKILKRDGYIVRRIDMKIFSHTTG